MPKSVKRAPAYETALYLGMHLECLGDEFPASRRHNELACSLIDLKEALLYECACNPLVRPKPLFADLNTKQWDAAT